MTEPFRQQLTNVKQKVEDTQKVTTQLRREIEDKLRILLKQTPKYEENWAGDWTENSNHYYNNFNSSIRQEMTIDLKFIKQDLINTTGIDLDELRNEIPSISKQFFVLREFILTELSFIKDIEVFKNEAELLKQIEEFKWGMTPGDYTRSRRPRYAFVSDPSIVNRGISTPPHILIGEDLIFTFSMIASYDDFEKLSNRLLRQLEIKASTSVEAEAGAIFQQKSLQAIIEKFHSVATQLKNRYSDRTTITIEDEYDVQDLMNALLRINFEDVRKEEYTPSYAGGSTRVDFLLKREKILIEVKKTRPTLKDKDVGNQLINDIAHYKSHPDCKHLICFVYDADNLITNPRGLEDDLNRNTSEDMIVEVYVRP